MENSDATLTENVIDDSAGRLCILEDANVRVEIDPALGGKIRALTSKRTGLEYFYQDKRKSFGTEGYSQHDISGFDECFPTIASCGFGPGRWEGLEIQDHGWLWNREWEVERRNGEILMRVRLDEIPIIFERSCLLTHEGSLCLNYSIQNHGTDPVPYLYGAHLMLSAGASTTIVYPAEMSRAYFTSALNMPDIACGAWSVWPPARPSAWEPYSGERGTAAKFFSDRLAHGLVGIRHGEAESLRIRFDAENLPHLGVMISQGFGPLGQLDGNLIIGLEPTTGIGDDLPTARDTGTLKTVQPGESLNFWIVLSLSANSA